MGCFPWVSTDPVSKWPSPTGYHAAELRKTHSTCKKCKTENQDCFDVICRDYNHVQDDMNVFVLVIKKIEYFS